jgi:RimJ/RimL family protein N-acetyltransferase
MPWISQEPISPEERVDMLRRFVAEFELRQDFVYGIFSLDESQVLGGTGLHTRRGKDVREIGYWIHADYTRQGLATESTMALVRVAIEIDQVRRVEIRNDPKNLASRAIPKKLGFTREDILEGDPEFPGAGRDTEIWSLLASFYSSSPALQLQIKAFDAFNQPIPLE